MGACTKRLPGTLQGAFSSLAFRLLATFRQKGIQRGQAPSALAPGGVLLTHTFTAGSGGGAIQPAADDFWARYSQNLRLSQCAVLLKFILFSKWRKFEFIKFLFLQWRQAIHRLLHVRYVLPAKQETFMK